MLELLAGMTVAALALALVLQPLVVRRPQWAGWSPADEAEAEPLSLEEDDSPKVRALLALKEIEFDRATGKLSDEDYAALKVKYSRQALVAMEAEGAEGTAGAEEAGDALDAAGQAIARAKLGGRACPACGPRPESTAVFCSACGRNLTLSAARARCPSCGSPHSEAAKFCAECGVSVAA